MPAINIARVLFRLFRFKRFIRHIVKLNTACTEPQTSPNLGTWNGSYYIRCFKLRLLTSSRTTLTRQDFKKNGIKLLLVECKHSLKDGISQQGT